MRNAGIHALDSHLVALLDDDDEWLPAKLERQVQAYVEAREQGILHPIVATRVFIQDVAGTVVATAPIDLLQPGQTVGDYLFRRKRIRRREAMLLPSTLLFDRGLALEFPFDEALFGGEDRAWLLGVSVRSDTRIVHLHEPLARYTEHRGGKSRSLSWPASLAWLSAQEDVLSKTERADSMLCNVATQALMAHDIRGFFTVLWQAHHLRAASWRAWFYICFAVFVYAAMDWCLAWMRYGRQLLRTGWLGRIAGFGRGTPDAGI
jgi:glycosyltransferase involved in cell wall biosynthesis